MSDKRTPPPPGFTPREPYDESMTTTLLIPIRGRMTLPETGSETVIAAIPDDMVDPPPASPGSRPEVALELLRLVALSEQHVGEKCREAQWWITRDPAVVEQRAQGDRCPTCRAGVDQALARMRDSPGVVMAVGRLSWCG